MREYYWDWTLATALAWLGLAANTGALVTRGIAAGRVPYVTMYEYLMAFAWAARPQESQCVVCHSYAVRRQWLDIVPKWKASVHAAQSVGCKDCHGGNPREDDFNKAMYGVPGFTARWSKRDLPAMCARCHADPARMRPYNLATDQYAQYKQSVHGLRLLQGGDTNVAACTDCHGVHDIRAPDNPQSRVYKTNVPKLCANCHANKQLMARYGLAGDEYEQYVTSVHGRKLLEDADRAAPSCADCHGTHGATPPGVEQVPAVCGRCHARTQQDFNAGPHSVPLEATGKPRCVDCHGDHGIKLPSDAMLAGDARGHCGSCHGPGTRERQAGERIRSLLAQEGRNLAASVHLVSRAADADMDVSDLRPQLDQANTALIEARALQHSLSVQRVQERMADASKIMTTVKRAAGDALADSRRRRNTILGGVVGLALGAVVLWLKRRQLMSELPPAA